MTKGNLAALIDALGDVRNKQAELEAKEKELKENLAELDAGAYTGHEFVLVISTPERAVFDQKAAKEELGQAWVDAHTTKVPYRTLKLSARNGGVK